MTRFGLLNSVRAALPMFQVENVHIVVMLALLLFAQGCSSGASGWVGKYSPYTRLTTLDGDSLALQSYLGKKVVLLFWATDCSGSKGLLEKLNALARAKGGRGQIVFLAASLDSDIEQVQNYIKYREIDAVNIAFSGNNADDEAFQAFRLKGIPAAIVINEEGQVVAAGDGEEVLKAL